ELSPRSITGRKLPTTGCTWCGNRCVVKTKNRPPMTVIPETITTLPGRYNYPGCWLFLQEKGKALYGRKFRLCPEEGAVIAKLLIWALKDSESAQQRNIDLGKGIMLTGPVGCGKTSLMKL